MYIQLKNQMKIKRYNYGTAILSAFEYLLENYKETFIIGQGLWSPWYVGNSMTDLDKNFGRDRVIDTPVSESATTGIAIGASLAGSSFSIKSLIIIATTIRRAEAVKLS